MDFLEEHLSEDVSLDVLSDLVRLSPYHFLRSFKQSFGSRRIATGRAAGLSAQRPCWQTPAHRLPRLRSMLDSMARARSALPFIGSLGKHLPTIAATLNDARHDGAAAEAARRPTARLPLLRLPRLESE
jgi:AraC-like DNA-binding protein